MFESLLPAVTLVALGLVGPASLVAMLMARGRHASVSSGADRRGRAAVAAVLVALAGGVAAWLLGAGVAAAVVAALALAVPVVVWSFLAPWWPVRAVVAWAMLVTGAVGALAMATARALESSAPWMAVPVTAVGAAVVVAVLGRLNPPFRRLLGIRAGVRRAVRTPLLLRRSMARPALAMTVFAASLAAGALTGVNPGPRDSAPEAGLGPRPYSDGSDARPVSAGTAGQPGAGGADPTVTTEEGGSSNTRDDMRGRVSGPGSLATPVTDGSRTSSSARSGDTSEGTSLLGAVGSGGGGSTGGGGTTGTVEDSAGTVQKTTETVQKSTETVQNEVSKTTEPVTSTVEKTTESVTSTVEKTTETVEKTTEPVTSTVEKTTESVTSTVEKTTESVTSGVGDTVDGVTGSIGSSLP